MTGPATTIQGERVRLAPVGMEHAALLRDWVNDPGTRHLLGGPAYQLSLAVEEEWLRARQEISWSNGMLLGIEALDVPGAPRLIGTIELRNLSAESRRGEIGLNIGDPAYRGRGYGTEALRLLCRFAFEEMDLRRLELSVLEFNARAIRSYRSVGFVEEGRQRERMFILGQYYDDVVMGLLREEFEAGA
jgi:RimJ/RimL family protein N-acetyltransferase